MKFFAFFAAVLALGTATNPDISTWTIHEVAAAIENPNTDPALLPYLEAALDQMMEDAYAGQETSPGIVTRPIQEAWTMEQITELLHDPSTSPALLPYLEDALDELMIALFNGNDVTTVIVNIPSMNVNIWTLGELSTAVVNPDTDPELAIYLTHALNQMMTAIMNGEEMTSIAVMTPPGVPVEAPELINPVPVVIEPIAPVMPPLPIFPIVVLEPVTPEDIVPPVVVVDPVQPVPAVSSPLVQVIINVNAQ